MTGIDAAARGDRRQEATAGIVIAGAVLVIGWASGFGVLTGNPLTSAQAATPPASAPALTEKPFTETGPAVSGVEAVTGESAATSTTAAVGSSDGVASPSMPTTPVSVPAATPAGAQPVTPASPTTPGTETTPGAPAEECSTGTAEAALAPLMTHVTAAHLQTSPGQQVADLLNVDDYVKAHTVLVDQVLAPVTSAVMAGTQAVDPLMTHVTAAHLQTSPGQQVADLLNVDDYVKAHTVLVDSMLAPASSALEGGCG